MSVTPDTENLFTSRNIVSVLGPDYVKGISHQTASVITWSLCLYLPDKSATPIPPNILSYVSIMFHSGIDCDVEARCSRNAVLSGLPTSDGSVLNSADTE